MKEKYKEYHAFIDIFPVDGVPSRVFEERLLRLTQKILTALGNASAFTYTPSKHFSDSKEDNVELKNKIRTFIKYILITFGRGINTQKFFPL